MEIKNVLGVAIVAAAVSMGSAAVYAERQSQASQDAEGAAMQQQSSDPSAQAQQEGAQNVGMQAAQTLTGTIDEVNTQERTISVDQGALQMAEQVSIDESTEIRDGQRMLELSQLQQGDQVTIEYTQQGDRKVGERVIINARAGSEAPQQPAESESGAQGEGSRWY